MSTSAIIAMQNSNNSIIATRLNWDGYPAHAGALLCKLANSAKQARRLIAQGELRCIMQKGAKLYREHYSNADPAFNCANLHSLLAQMGEQGADFCYLYCAQEQCWFCYNSNKKQVPLAQAIKKHPANSKVPANALQSISFANVS